jgi:hypothetical protein
METSTPLEQDDLWNEIYYFFNPMKIIKNALKKENMDNIEGINHLQRRSKNDENFKTRYRKIWGKHKLKKKYYFRHILI